VSLSLDRVDAAPPFLPALLSSRRPAEPLPLLASLADCLCRNRRLFNLSRVAAPSLSLASGAPVALAASAAGDADGAGPWTLVSQRRRRRGRGAPKPASVRSSGAPRGGAPLSPRRAGAGASPHAPSPAASRRSTPAGTASRPARAAAAVAGPTRSWNGDAPLPSLKTLYVGGVSQTPCSHGLQRLVASSAGHLALGWRTAGADLAKSHRGWLAVSPPPSVLPPATAVGGRRRQRRRRRSHPPLLPAVQAFRPSPPALPHERSGVGRPARTVDGGDGACGGRRAGASGGQPRWWRQRREKTLGRGRGRR